MHNKVLIVEDDIDIVELLRLYLESSNYITSAASDGLMALDILKKQKETRSAAVQGRVSPLYSRN